MTWVRIDEGFPEHPKVIAAGPLASWLHVCAIAYCNRQLTDGFISAAVLPRLSDGRRTRSHAAILVDVGLWEVVDGGWLIHDFLTYQPSKAKVEAERSAARERMAHARSRSPDVRPNNSRTPEDVRPNNQRSSEEVRITRPGPSRPVPISQSSSNSSNGQKHPTDDDQFMHTIEIIVEHKYRNHPPNGTRRAWETTVVPNTITEDGPQIRELLAAGRTPLDAASTVIGSARSAEIAESKLA